MKGLFQCPPRASPWVKWQSAKRPVRAKALYIARYLKAFALTGRQSCVHKHPGRCPGLGASALSGRVGLTCETRRITPTGLFPGTPGVLETSDD